MKKRRRGGLGASSAVHQDEAVRAMTMTTQATRNVGRMLGDPAQRCPRIFGELKTAVDAWSKMTVAVASGVIPHDPAMREDLDYTRQAINKLQVRFIGACVHPVQDPTETGWEAKFRGLFHKGEDVPKHPAPPPAPGRTGWEAPSNRQAVAPPIDLEGAAGYHKQHFLEAVANSARISANAREALAAGECPKVVMPLLHERSLYQMAKANTQKPREAVLQQLTGLQASVAETEAAFTSKCLRNRQSIPPDDTRQLDLDGVGRARRARRKKR